MSSSSTPPDRFDVCLVCAMAEEVEALIKVIEHLCQTTLQHGSNSTLRRAYRYATIYNNNAEPLQLHVSWQDSYGPGEASLHMERILSTCKPKFVGMTGICAGDRSKTRLGDIIIAERAYLYETGKYALDENGQSVHLLDTTTWQLRPETRNEINVFREWEQAVQELASMKDFKRPSSREEQRDWLLKTLLELPSHNVWDINEQELEQFVPDWRDILTQLQQGETPFLDESDTLIDPQRVRRLRRERPFPYKDPEFPKKHISPIASGQAVRADNPFAEIRDPVRNTIAIDMEGAAFYRAAANYAGVEQLLVKGVSDYADAAKDDSYHDYAAYVSAAYMISFIRHYVRGKASSPSKPQHKLFDRDAAELQPPPGAVRIFLSSSQAEKDRNAIIEFRKHLRYYEREKTIFIWHNQSLLKQGATQEDIDTFIQQAQIVLIGVSPDYDRYDELDRAMSQRETGATIVIPLLIRPEENWKQWHKGKFGEILSVPRYTTLTNVANKDTANMEAAKALQKVIEGLKERGEV